MNLDPVTEQTGAIVHESVVLASGVALAAGTLLQEGVRVGPHVVFVAAQGDERPAQVQRCVSIGANATIYAGIVLAAKAVVRPGAVVTRSVPPGAIVEGNPAIIVGYVDTLAGSFSATADSGRPPVGIDTSPVRGVSLHHFPVIPDLRGSLTVGEFAKEIPFAPLRYFMVFDVPSREVRGEHAHRECHQFLICVRGSCAVVADDGRNRMEVTLDAPHKGLYLPPMTWGVQYKYSADALLLVFASHHYDNADYIRNYAEFLELAAQR